MADRFQQVRFDLLADGAVRLFERLLWSCRGTFCISTLVLASVVSAVRLLLREGPEALELHEDGPVDASRLLRQQATAFIREPVDAPPHGCEEARLLQIGLRPAEAVVEDGLLAARQQFGPVLLGELKNRWTVDREDSRRRARLRRRGSARAGA